MSDDGFEAWLGQVANERLFRHDVHKALNLARGSRLSSGNRPRRFNGSHIARGSATARILGTANRNSGPRCRKAVVRVRIVRLGRNGAKAAAAHLRYLERDGTARDGERGTLYSADFDTANGKLFLERSTEDRHQFRVIVSAEDGAEYLDLKPMIRRLMEAVERDLGTKLDWVAVDHFNNGHPHSHILLRGKDDRGGDLIIAPEYIYRGLRCRATDLVNLDLGPRSDLEIVRANLSEIRQERFTGIDRRLLQAIDAAGLVSSTNVGSIEQSLRAGRLAKLGRMGLAIEEGNGRWRLSDELEPTLRAIGKRGDIMATLDREVRSRQLAVSRAEYAICDPDSRDWESLVGRISARGVSHDEAASEYVIVEGVDGRAHYVEIGSGGSEHAQDNAIVRIIWTPVSARKVERGVAKIDAADRCRYGEEFHPDQSASERLVQTNASSLEAFQRSTDAAGQGPDRIWNIASENIEGALQYRRRGADHRPIHLEPLTSMALEQMPAHNGITWLDEDPSVTQARGRCGSFGWQVANAMQRRQQWLIEKGLAGKPDMLDILRRRELKRVTGQISRELGANFVEAAAGRAVEGFFRRSVHVGGTRMAVIENSREFTLVPWRPELGPQIGKLVSGTMRGRNVSWTFGRERPGPEI